ncbi:MAG: ABC transporter ATP-binding protein [Antricoccus sp.]
MINADQINPPKSEAIGPRNRSQHIPAIELRGATLAYGDRELWSELNLQVQPGEFVAVLGPNGAGKTSLLRVLLGQQPLAAGTVAICGRPVRTGSRLIGYVPQEKSIDLHAPLRSRDFVGLGLDGHRWGFTLPSRSRRLRIDSALADVGASAYADAPLSLLSGGERQRLRIAQALITDPRVLLCDEPLISLDLSHQSAVTELISRACRDRGVACLFVTHEINPILPVADRVVYFASGRARIGTPDEVMRTDVLTDLYRAPIEVIRRGDRIVVFGAEDVPHHPHESGEHR